MTVASQRPRRGRYLALGAVLILIAAVAAAAIMFATSRATLSNDSSALARVSLPLGGGKIVSISAVTGPHSRPVPVELRGEKIWPRKLLKAGQRVSIQVVVKRPGWISWLAGKTQRLTLSLLAPTTRLRTHYMTLAGNAPLRLHFTPAVSVIAYGPVGHLRRHVLASPQSDVTLDRSADAGSIWVAAAPRTWETSSPSVVSWFPAGAATAAVSEPAPGSQIQPSTPITLTFSKPVSQALGSARPPVSPITQGTWHTVNPHTIIFRPEGYGYGLGAHVAIGLPAGVRLVGGGGTWTVRPGSTLRLQQMLSLLGYLPLNFHYRHHGVARDALAQENAAVKPPAGHFTWRYSNVPPALHNFWSPGAAGVMTRGALMAFESDHGLTPDGVPGPQVWRSLIDATVTGHRSSFGYTFVSVTESSQRLSLWHNGNTVTTTPVNTGIASAPTATGTYPVYEHISSGTMSGTNPDGSHYNDPGVPWISYFNGGDALHGFYRAQYGFPQSLGCVEMPVDMAAKVWPYTPVGTLVNVT